MSGRRGNPRLDQVRNTDTSEAKVARVRRADEFAVDMRDFVATARYDHGAKPYGVIARWLNVEGAKTPHGSAWSSRQVGRLVHRLATLAK